MCLQETKTEDKFFPSESFEKIGMKHQYHRGEKSYNGVAILSNFKLEDENFINWCGKKDTRHISVKLNKNIELHNFYIPAGGDDPDIYKNPKFQHKISFLNEMMSFFSKDINTNKILATKISPSIMLLSDAGSLGVRVVNDDAIVEFIPIKILEDTQDGIWITGIQNFSNLIVRGQGYVENGQQVIAIPSSES